MSRRPGERAPRASLAIAIVVALLAPAIGASPDPSLPWTQANGGGGHPGYALLPSTPLDVLGETHLFAKGMSAIVEGSIGYAETKGSIFTLASADDSGACTFVTLPTRAGANATSQPLGGCNTARLLDSSPARGTYLMCSFANGPTAPLIQARRFGTNEVVWQLTPADIIGPTAAPTDAWVCQTYAGDDAADRGAITLAGIPGGRAGGIPNSVHGFLATFSLATGQLAWERPVDEATFRNVPARAEGITAPPSPAFGNVLLWGVSMTSTGIVLQASIQESASVQAGLGASQANVRGAAAWYSFDGALQGAAISDTSIGGTSRTTVPHYVPHGAPARGPLAAFPFAGRILVVNPNEAAPVNDVPFAPADSGVGYNGVAAPAWWQDHLVVALGPSVSDVDPAHPETIRWSWTPGALDDISSVFIAPPGDVYVTIAHQNETASEAGDDTLADASLVRLSLQTGTVLSRIPMPMPGTWDPNSNRWYVEQLPLTDGRLVLADQGGNVVFLGAADAARAPHAAISNAYPAPGEEFSVTLPTGSASYLVSFGDSDPIAAAAGARLTHRYAVDGTRTLLVTAIAPDGTTATSVSAIRVGAAPPVELTAIQAAFAPENQNITFGVLGLLVTLAGALFALLARRRRQSRLDALIHELERVRAGASADPIRAVRDLEGFRARILGELRGGSLDDAQFSVLELRVATILRSLRLRILAPFAGRVSDEFRHLVEAALEDGRVTREEAAALHAGLDRETRLTPEDRARLSTLVGVWERA